MGHNNNKIIFALLVDTFGVKNSMKESSESVIKGLRDKYEDLDVN